jgi:hypothetical protein
MAVIAAFQLATAPNQPQSQGVPVPNNFRAPPARFTQTVITLNKFFRPPDPGVGHAY